MLKFLSKFLSLSVLALVGVVGLLFYRQTTATQNKIAALESAVSDRQGVIDRLSAERRVADFVVAEQDRTADGTLRTTLFMVEYDRAGRAVPARSFAVLGEHVHLDALVIKFAADDVQKDEPLRGHALLLLEKIYGDAQRPADAPRIDEPGVVPAVYRDVDPQVGRYERELWASFWALATDASLREARHVKVAHGAGVFVKPEPGKKYGVTLQADGNLTVYDEPLPQIFDGFVKRGQGG